MLYCRTCGAKATHTTKAGFIKDLASPCVPPRLHGTRSIALLQQGKLPVNLASWPEDLLDYNLMQASNASPCSEFVQQVLEDHPGLTHDEAKHVASTLLRFTDLNSIDRKNTGNALAPCPRVAKRPRTMAAPVVAASTVERELLIRPSLPAAVPMPSEEDDTPIALASFSASHVVPYTAWQIDVSPSFLPMQVDEPEAPSCNNRIRNIIRSEATFNGSAMDSEDLQWYNIPESQPMQVDSVSIPVDRHSTAEGISNIDVITQIHNIPSRQIVRMDSEQV